MMITEINSINQILERDQCIAPLSFRLKDTILMNARFFRLTLHRANSVLQILFCLLDCGSCQT